MAFTDMRNFQMMAPPEYKDSIIADFDNLKVSVRGFTVAVRVDDRRPYSLITIGSAESPVEFVGQLHFMPGILPGKTDFSISLDANLNFIMKGMMGGKIQQALDKAVDALVDISEGRTPDIAKDIL